MGAAGTCPPGYPQTSANDPSCLGPQPGRCGTTAGSCANGTPTGLSTTSCTARSLGGWGPWSPSSCSAPAQRTRTRTCTDGSYGGLSTWTCTAAGGSVNCSRQGTGGGCTWSCGSIATTQTQTCPTPPPRCSSTVGSCAVGGASGLSHNRCSNRSISAWGAYSPASPPCYSPSRQTRTRSCIPGRSGGHRLGPARTRPGRSPVRGFRRFVHDLVRRGLPVAESGVPGPSPTMLHVLHLLVAFSGRILPRNVVHAEPHLRKFWHPTELHQPHRDTICDGHQDLPALLHVLHHLEPQPLNCL